MDKAYLILANGAIFEGKAIGKTGSTIGEIVFTTGMTGYTETLTDPSYYGQIVMQTFPLIGNYGISLQDFESKKAWLNGYIVHELCEKPSNFRSEYTLESFLQSQGIIGIAGIDTRHLTKLLRNIGVMNAMIISGKEIQNIDNVLKNPLQKESLLSKIRNYKITNALKAVQQTPSNIRISETNAKEIKTVVIYNFGAKENIIRELQKRRFNVISVPYNTTAQEIIKLKPDGLILSNGPGDPSENIYIIEEIKKICEWNKNTNAPITIFGICLGHQLLALANGAKTSKLKYGHRGANHPVKDLENGRIYITSQNHGYAVENASLPPSLKLRFINMNDNTCEGIDYTDIPAFSVQFHPEACGGPHDTNFLFDKFAKMIMERNSYAIK